MTSKPGMDLKQIEKLVTLPEERLYIGLGTLLLAEDLLETGMFRDEQDIEGLYGLQPDSSAFGAIYAQRFLNEQSANIKQRICVEWDYCGKRNDPELTQTANLVAAIADALLAFLVRSPIVVATIATILVRKGLNAYCNCAQTE